MMHADYAPARHLRQCSLDRRTRGPESEISTFTYVVPLRALYDKGVSAVQDEKRTRVWRTDHALRCTKSRPRLLVHPGRDQYFWTCGAKPMELIHMRSTILAMKRYCLN